MSRRLTETDVIDIRRRFLSGESVAALAAEYERTTNGIRNIATGKSWPDVLMPVVESSAMAVCRVCDARLNFITPTHLAKHDMTVEQYREKYPDAELTGAGDHARRAANARVQNEANFADGGNAKVKAKMSRKAKVRAKRDADAGTERYTRFQAASRKFTAELWEDPEWLAKMKPVSSANAVRLRTRLRGSIEMNQKEAEVFRLIQPLGFEFVGNGVFWIRRGSVAMNPDFIRRSDRMIVEFFGDYWHQGETGEERVAHFSAVGWKTVIVWQSEFVADPGCVLRRLSENA